MNIKLSIFHLLFCLILIESRAQTFSDVAILQGIQHSLTSADNWGNGVGFFDIDNDNWDDITLLKENDTLSIYRNNQGSFEPLELNIYISGETKHALWFDFDNDGDNDLFVSVKNAPCHLYKNEGNFIFTEITIQAGLFDSAGPNYGASVADYNKDGYLDIYLCRYADPIVNPTHLQFNALYKNNGNGTFTNVATAAGVDDGMRNSFQAVWLDYNKDSWPDIYVINDRYPYYNALYENNGNGTFTDVTMQSGTADTLASPMSNSVADFDNDGDLDIYMSNVASPDSGRLLVNNNNGTFTDMAAAYGVQNSEYTWGAAWFDAENDADLDLLVTSDINTPNPRNYLYINTGAQLFVEAPQNFQSNNIASSRSVGVGDISNDGKADIIVSNTDGFNSFLWESTGQVSNNFIKITLQGSTSNKMAIGSWIDVYAGSIHLTHYTLCGENYLGQNSQHKIFGLGQESLVDSVVIHFPSGIIDQYYGLAVNQSYTFTESNLNMVHISYTDSLVFCEGDSAILDAGNYNNFLWSNGANTRYLTVFTSGYYWVDVTNNFGLILFSDTLFIEVIPAPQISMVAEDISCFGLNDGNIILEINNQTNNYTVNWNQGLQGDTILNLSEGNYTYQYNDIFGCSATDSIHIYNPFQMVVYTQVIGYSISGMGSIQTVINGGTAPYEIYLDSILIGNFIDSLLPGIYFFEVIDANGCIYSADIEIIDYTITNLSNKQEKRCYFENPFSGNQLSVVCFNRIDEIGVFDLLGRALPFVFDDGKIIFLNDFEGMFILAVTINESKHFYKILRQ